MKKPLKGGKIKESGKLSQYLTVENPCLGCLIAALRCLNHMSFVAFLPDL